MKKEVLILIIILLLPIVNAVDDIYEDDDAVGNAKYIAINGISQTHNFSPSADIDWVKFNATKGYTYVIQTLNLSDIDITDTVIALYHTDATTKISDNDDIESGVIRTSKIIWKAPINGTYYVKIYEWSDQANGSYNISVTQMGLLMPYLVFPNSTYNVSQKRYFNFTSGVQCVGGPCNDVIATLDPQNPKQNKKLLDDIKSKGKLDIIIKFRENEEDVKKSKKGFGVLNVDREKIKNKQKSVLSSLENKFKLKRELELTNSIAGEIDEEELLELLENPDVEDIKAVREYSAMLDDSVPLINASILHNTLIDGQYINGTGQTVCVIDTGINYSHPDFGSCARTNNINDGSCDKVIGGYDFVNNDNDPYDDHGHGSHVAGIAASMDSTYKGVAPGAKIVAIKVLNSLGKGSDANIIAGIQWCIANASRLNISVISMSIGTENWHENASIGCEDDNLASSINLARAAGIIVMVASGNEDFGNGISTQGLASPACVKNSTSIGSTTKADSMAYYTNRNLMLDLLAPGGIPAVRIVATDYSGTHAGEYGTSMATPHAAGTAALIQQYFNLKYNRTLTPSELEHILKSNGKSIIDSIGTNYTFTRINANYAANSKGDISTTIGAEPFYTISANPHDSSCLINMQNGESCNQTWVVNATGNGTYEFFTIYETDYFEYNITEKINITIIELNNSVVNLTLDGNDSDIIVNINQIVNITGYLITPIGVIDLYMNGTLINNGTSPLTNLTNFTNYGTYSITVVYNGNENYSGSTETHSVIVRDTIAPLINITSPVNSTTYTYSYQTPLTFTTDKSSNCSYSLDGNSSVYFSSVATTFSKNLNIYRNSLHNISVNCTNSFGYSNTTIVYFTINDVSAPVILSSGPSGTDNDGDITLTVMLNEPASCRYATTNKTYSQMTDSMSLSSGLTYTKAISDLSNGDYDYYVRCNDSLGNLMSSSEHINFSVSISSGGGGGGGGGSSVSSDANTHKWGVINQGSSASMSLSGSYVITELSFTAEEKMSNVEISINPSDDNPAIIDPPGDVYKYFDISAINLKSTSSAKIRFTVKKTWLMQNKISDVVLMRYKNGQWDALNTKKVSDSVLYNNYESSTPGFSYFAIVSKGKVYSAATNKTKEKEEPKVTSLIEDNELDEKVKEYEEKLKKQKTAIEPTNYFGFISTVLIIAILLFNIALYYFISKKVKKGEDFFS